MKKPAAREAPRASGQRRLKAGSLKLLNTFSGEMGTASTDRRQPLVVSHSLTILRWVNKAFSTRTREFPYSLVRLARKSLLGSPSRA